MKMENPLNHIETINRLLRTVRASEKMHALIVMGPAGWGKTTAVDEALRLSGTTGCALGAYSTPLNLFNFLHDHASELVIIDDSAGLYNEPSAMAILKAATWAQGKPRVLRWGSTTGKANAEEFEFKGKLIIVGNTFPNLSDAEAVKSRAFPCKIEISAEKAKALLESAAQNKKWYKNTKQAARVAQFLVQVLSAENLSQISYRTLQMGYELAEHNPDDWEILLSGMISTGAEDPKKLIRKLSRERISVSDQLLKFEQVTGMKRRTFFKYRRELNISNRA
jgi:DNA polymerase III delta prime subunit